MLFQNQQKMLIQESLTWQNPIDQQDHTTVRPGPTNQFGNTHTHTHTHTHSPTHSDMNSC